MSKPTFPQMEHFFRLVEEDKITVANFQAFLQNPGRFFAGFPVSYDQSLGLVSLIQRAVGERNLRNIDRDITPQRFKLAGTGVRTVNLRVEPSLDGETPEQAAIRLRKVGHTLRNTGDLAGFLHDHPDEVEKWAWVLAISEDSRWSRSGGNVCVPCAFVGGACRLFHLHGLRGQLDSRYGVLVSSESGD